MTLVEFMFVMVALSIFLTALIQITIGGMRAYQRGMVQTQLKYRMRLIVDKISTDLRQAVPTTGSAGFITPTRTTTSTGRTLTLDFHRYRYDVSETTRPKKDIRVQYNVAQYATLTLPISIGGTTSNVSFRMQTLTRVETNEATGYTTSELLADNVVQSDNSGGSFTEKTYFQWAPDPTNSSLANLNVMTINLKMLQTAGVGKPEWLEAVTRASLRPSRESNIGSNFPATAAFNYLTNLMRFGEPTSLVRP